MCVWFCWIVYSEYSDSLIDVRPFDKKLSVLSVLFGVWSVYFPLHSLICLFLFFFFACEYFFSLLDGISVIV